jgi:hypothetical protein
MGEGNVQRVFIREDIASKARHWMAVDQIGMAGHRCDETQVLDDMAIESRQLIKRVSYHHDISDAHRRQCIHCRKGHRRMRVQPPAVGEVTRQTAIHGDFDVEPVRHLHRRSIVLAERSRDEPRVERRSESLRPGFRQ